MREFISLIIALIAIFFFGSLGIHFVIGLIFLIGIMYLIGDIALDLFTFNFKKKE